MVKKKILPSASAMVLFLLASGDSSDAISFIRRGAAPPTRNRGAFVPRQPFAMGNNEDDYLHRSTKMAMQEKKRHRKRASKKIDQALSVMKEEEQQVEEESPAIPFSDVLASTTAATGAAAAALSPDMLQQFQQTILLQSLVDGNRNWMEHAKQLLQLREKDQQQLRSSSSPKENASEIELQFASGNKFSGKLTAKGFSPYQLQEFGKVISLYYVLPVCVVCLLFYCLFK